jgi:chorismate dehydratase
MILDNAPARSSELLSQGRVDAALVPVIAFQHIDGVRLIPDVCVGAKRRVRSVCLVTNGAPLEDVRSVSLDVSSQTSITLSQIIFREFLGREPEWRRANPQIKRMLSESDCALLIGDPALSLSAMPAEMRVFDLAELWHQYTGLGFVFAMWMTKLEISPIDFAASRDEGLEHLDEIAGNYAGELPLSRDEIRVYLSENISYAVDDGMQAGLEMYFHLAAKNGLVPAAKPLVYAR